MGNASSSPRIHNNTDEILKIVCTDKDGRETSQIVRKMDSWQPTIPYGKVTISVFILAEGVPVAGQGDAVLNAAESCYDFTVQLVKGMVNITQDYSNQSRKIGDIPRITNATNGTLTILCTDKDGRKTSQIVTSQNMWHPSIPSGPLTVFASHLRSGFDKDVEGAVYTATSSDNFTVKLVEGRLNIKLQ
ncbi:uncharacterized protein LOC115927089 [Strongylocentrotus purpuratus]|uniref:Uncharacterized protein n=1 Tax=Strongylocentrotus purpuratus TaxID=7668 RepID=A0A7M7PAD1_STRPU|nr:uncharacterized protein LOC115927089 [Strongylocentrotus purpuratus]